MVQSGHLLGIFLLLSPLCLGQLDHFLPPPPARLNHRQRLRFRPQVNAVSRISPNANNLFSANPYLSRAYGGAWFRSNFQDLFSNRGAQKLEWFEVIEGTTCSPVPATVNAGRPPRDICMEAAVDERRCICINTGRSESESGYEQICGNCRDPCQLKFTPDKVPTYLQRLAVQDLDKDVENGNDDEVTNYDDYEK